MNKDHLPPLPLVDGCLIIDNSTLEKFTTCPRSYNFYGLHKRELAETRMPLVFGEAVHQALEYRYGHAVDAYEPEFMDVKQGMKDILEEALREVAIPPDDHRTIGFGHDLIEAYCKYGEYQVEPFQVMSVTIDGRTRLANELPFMIPLATLRGIPVFWSGRIDLIVKWSDGEESHLDHKTTSRLGESYFDDYKNDQGQIGYAWAKWKLTGEMPKGFTINAICCRKPTRTGVMFEFQRRRFALDPERILEWEENVCWVISDLLQMYENGRFPAHTKWCAGKYGPCPYLDVCTLPLSSRGMLLQGPLYKDVTWSPLKKEFV